MEALQQALIMLTPALVFVVVLWALLVFFVCLTMCVEAHKQGKPVPWFDLLVCVNHATVLLATTSVLGLGLTWLVLRHFD